MLKGTAAFQYMHGGRFDLNTKNDSVVLGNVDYRAGRNPFEARLAVFLHGNFALHVRWRAVTKVARNDRCNAYRIAVENWRMLNVDAAV